MRNAIVCQPLLRDIAAYLLTTATLTSACSLEVNNSEKSGTEDSGTKTSDSDDGQNEDPESYDAGAQPNTDEENDTSAESSAPQDNTSSEEESESVDHTTVYADAGADETSNVEPADAAIPDVSPKLVRPSRCTSIDVSLDDTKVVAVNTDSNSVSVFDTALANARVDVAVDAQPTAVVLDPLGTTAFVVNRGGNNVQRITGIGSEHPSVDKTLALGAEPVCAALSPDGKVLYVTEWAEGNVAVIDTAEMKLLQLLQSPINPYGLVVTDEVVLATEFYGEISEDQANLGKDEMFNRGVVRVFEPEGGSTAVGDSTFNETAPIYFAARDSTFPDPRNAEGTTTIGPNQLHSITVNAGKVYVTATGTAPLGAPRFDANVFPMVYVADLATRSEDQSALGTQNLAALVRDNMEAEVRNFAADIVALDFPRGTNVAYVVSRAGEVVQRLRFDGDQVEFGSDATGVQQINVGGAADKCKVPNGIVTLHDGSGAWVSCFGNSKVARIEFDSQSATEFVASAALPTPADVNRGRIFFHTGLAQWSKQAWSSCASCHPNGLSDNVTYQFPAGPRQSTELGSSFLEEDSELVQRVFNWTGIFDEIHDFAANTTLVQGGARPLFAADGQDCANGTVGFAAAADFPGGLAKPVREVEDGSCNPDDFDEMEAYIKTIRPARGLVRYDQGAFERGRELFIEGGCNNCHGGERSTLSRLFFEPTEATNAALALEPFSPAAGWLPSWSLNQVTQIQIQDPGGPLEQAPPQVSCVIRNVGTFGVGDDITLSDAIERRATDARSQGEGGYNIPSLYGLALGAPYLHHGAAASLEELFSNPAFEQHWQAGNANFLTGEYAEEQRSDLIQYLLALDYEKSATQTPDPDANMDACPEWFTIEEVTEVEEVAAENPPTEPAAPSSGEEY